MKKRLNTLKLVSRACSDYFRIVKWRAILEQVTNITNSLTFIFHLLVIERLFEIILSDSIENQTQLALTYFLLLIMNVVLQQIFSGVSGFFEITNMYKNVASYMSDLQLKINRLPAVLFEESEFLDRLDRAKEFIEDEEMGDFIAAIMRGFTHHTVFIIGMSIYLGSLSPLLPLTILIAFIPAIIGQFLKIRLFEELGDETAPIKRQNGYYKNAIAGRGNFKETRLLGAFQYFYQLFCDTLNILNKLTWKARSKAIYYQLLLNLISFVGLGVAVLILFHTTMRGEIHIGAFVAVFAGLTQMFALVDEFVSTTLSIGSENLGGLSNYYEILGLQEVEGNKTEVEFTSGITVNDVNFTYPGATNEAIKNISLNIKDKETIAIVGENGSGKSTLVRLLTGIYLPDKGKVVIGGLDSRLHHNESFFPKISGVFQNYQRYKMKLKGNVAISCTNKMIDEKKVQYALKKSEFNHSSANLETMLATEFGGIELSGGGWQRVAIARSLYKLNDVIVFDEPTSSIDPLEEARLYYQFAELARDRLAIMVTHRLGATKLADRIVVMHNGTINDIGTHDELIKKNGIYTRMWQAQSSWYQG